MFAENFITLSTLALDKISVPINQMIQNADLLIDGLSRHLQWLAVDRLNATDHTIRSEIEERLNNTNAYLGIPILTGQQEIRHLNIVVSEHVNDALTKIREYIQVTSLLTNELLDRLAYQMTHEASFILEDLQEYHSPSTLIQISSQIALMDKLKEIISPTPEQILKLQKDFQELRLKDYKNGWTDKIPKPKAKGEN